MLLTRWRAFYCCNNVCMCVCFRICLPTNCQQIESKQQPPSSSRQTAAEEDQITHVQWQWNLWPAACCLQHQISVRNQLQLALFTLISIACCLHLSIWLMNGKIKKHLACRVRTWRLLSFTSHWCWWDILTRTLILFLLNNLASSALSASLTTADEHTIFCVQFQQK